MSFTSRRRAGVVGVAALTVAALIATGSSLEAEPATAAPAAAPGLQLQLVWERTLNSQAVSLGSPGVGDLDGQGPSVIVGTISGMVHAMHASDGTDVAGWPYQVKGIGIASTPSTYTYPDAKGTRVYVGVGISNAPSKGGYLGLKYNGTKAFYRTITLLPNGKGSPRGVMSSLAVGNLHTGVDVVGGAMGQMQLAMSGSTGKSLPGFPWLMADTNFSTPAVARVRASNEKDFIIEGGDSTAGRSYAQTYPSGGHIRILRPTGNKGYKNPNDGLVCELKTNQVVQSSPAVGKFLADGKLGIVTGTGVFYKSRSDTNRVIAMDPYCTKKWSVLLDGDTRSSPAIADVQGDGKLDVVMMTRNGSVYALDGATGATIWKRSLGNIVYGSATTFQAPNGNFQYILAPLQEGLYVLDGRDGSVVTKVGGMRLWSSATVTRDPDGSIGITIAGQGGKTSAGKPAANIEHYRVVGSNVETVQTPGSWPMFHHDPQLTGLADSLPAPPD